MGKNILFRAVIEVLGKPKQHVDASLKGYIKKLKEDKHYMVLREECADTKKQDNSELWTAFAELEINVQSISDLINFCFDYMPSVVEITDPEELKLNNRNISAFLNDLQAKLHNVDMLAKQLRVENDTLKRNTSILLKNYVTVLLGDRRLSSEQLSRMTGVDKDRIEDFLDQLIDEGRIDLEKELYYRKERLPEGKHES